MTTQPPSFRWRTLAEIALIASVIYFFLGAPGLGDLLKDTHRSKPVAAPKAQKTRTESLVYPDLDLKCEETGYDVHIYSTKPLVIYVHGFLSGEEADALVELSQSKWQPSTVFNAGVETSDSSVRKSDKALIPRSPLVQCIEARALAFQGWPSNTFIERLWTQRYNVSGHYAQHYDWSSASREARRASTFMVYLGDECEGGGTEFPLLERREEGRWCEFVECGSEREGVAFRPRKGAAVFWGNFDEEGRGIRETVHAGLPVTRGVKVGLNIWSWWQRGLEVGDLESGRDEL